MSSTNKIDEIIPDAVTEQCTVKTTIDLINTDIAHTFAEHLADSSDYKPEIILSYFEKLRKWEELSSLEWARLIEIVEKDDHAELLSRFVSKHKNIFSGILSHLDDENNLQRNEHPLFDKDGKFVGFDRLKEHIVLNTESSLSQAKSVENIAWASEKMKTMLQSQYDKMHSTNKPYEGDMEKIQAWKDLDYREEAGVKIISLPWFWEFSSTTKSGTEYRDMDKNGTRSISNLKDSKKFKAFADTINWCEMMELSDTYKLMNMVGQQLGITDTIDEHYINAQFDKYSNINLPQENSLWRILRALYMMTGDWFVIPISVKGNMVRSIVCSDSNAWICDISSGGSGARPFSKIGGSPSA